MSAISYKDLVNDLSSILISFIEPMNLKFYFQNIEVSISEVLTKSGFMPIFLFDKQDFINYSLRHKTIDKLDTEAFAKLHFQTDMKAFLDLKIDIVHNLFTDDILNIDNSIYDSTLQSLAIKILSDKCLIIEKNSVHIDTKYEEFCKSFNEKNLEGSIIIEQIKGELS